MVGDHSNFIADIRTMVLSIIKLPIIDTPSGPARDQYVETVLDSEITFYPMLAPNSRFSEYFLQLNVKLLCNILS